MNFYTWAMNNGYSDNLSIERINVNGNYEPNNCTWITISEQSQNKTNNIVLTFNGKTNILSEWCKILNINYNMARKRYKSGLSVDKILANHKKYNLGG